MRRKDTLFRVASVLHRRLSRIPDPADAPFNNRITELMTSQAALAKLLKRIVLAKRHGWHLAAQRLKDDLPSNVRSVASACQELLRASEPRDIPVIPLRQFIDELRQLRAEFEHVDLSQRGRIIVTSESIELEGISLGRFAIELHLDRLKEPLGSSCFDCVALDPNPASGNEEVTHPHVQSNGLCAGDATLPIAIALRQGRICDAFCLVHSVLNTYNPSSPYISLDGWDGVSCGDCGYSTDRDNLSYCDGCSSDFCEECISSCDLCGTSRCRSCLETDQVSDHRCCADCRKQCAQCKRIVDSESFDDESGLCPGCLEEQQAQENSTDDQGETPNQENHDPYDPMPAVCSSSDSSGDPITVPASATASVRPPTTSAA